MKNVFIFLMVTTGLVTILCLPHAYSDFLPNGKYLIQASGYLSGNQTIFDSNIALQITIGSKSGNTIQSTLDNALITIADTHYLNSGIWQTSILRDGRYLVIQGDAQDQNRNIIHLNLFGRIIDSNQDGYVYTITGKITGSETMKVSYSAKIISTNTVITKPTIPTQTIPEQQSPSKVSISIVYGASEINNQVHYTPSNVQVSSGTIIIWTNNDSVPHRIMSGIAKPITIDQSTPPIFTADGKIDSGIIAPGQSFQFTITKFDTSQSLDQTVAKHYNIPQDQTAGDITFFDPTYPFMVGIIAPLSQPITQTKTVEMDIIQGALNPNNGQFLLPSSSLQITPGTIIVWTNNDSVPHRIMSGQLLTTTESTGGKGSTGKSVSPHFVSDGKIDSGIIAPGQHYQVTISNTGSTQFFDPSFTWINGIIFSSSITKGTPIQITINPGSSSPIGTATQQTYNQYNAYYTPDTVQIVPGTPIIWVNNDSIEHTILSGVSTQKNDNPFTPDGKITSGKIAPDQTFTVVVNDTGIIRFYDPQYTWMSGVIISMPPTSSYITGTKSLHTH